MVPDDGFTSLLFLLVHSGAFQSQGGRSKKGEKRVIKIGEWRLKGSASQCQKFHPGSQPHIRKQIHLSHHLSLTPQLYSRWCWALAGMGQAEQGRPEGTNGQRVPAQQPGPEPGLLTLET